MMFRKHGKVMFIAAAMTGLTGPSAAFADTASCLSDCTKAFAACNKRAISTKDFATCVSERKKCIDSCGSASD